MKYALTALILAAIAAAAGPANAGTSWTTTTQVHERPLLERSNMASVSLGESSKLTVLLSERDRMRKFYRDVLGCAMTKTSDSADVFQLGPSFYLGVVYQDSALSESDAMKSSWLELRTDRPEELKQKILKFAIKEIDYRDKEHFYFQAPGGQVFRLVGS